MVTLYSRNRMIIQIVTSIRGIVNRGEGDWILTHLVFSCVFATCTGKQLNFHNWRARPLYVQFLGISSSTISMVFWPSLFVAERIIGTTWREWETDNVTIRLINRNSSSCTFAHVSLWQSRIYAESEISTIQLTRFEKGKEKEKKGNEREKELPRTGTLYLF